MKRNAAVIAYDIVEDSRRRQVHRCLKAWGLAAQYSLFECQLKIGVFAALYGGRFGHHIARGARA